MRNDFGVEKFQTFSHQTKSFRARFIFRTPSYPESLRKIANNYEQKQKIDYDFNSYVNSDIEYFK